MFHSLRICLCVSLTVLAGCSEPQRGGPRVNTAPVSGIVTVDGQPAAFLQVDCHPEAGSEIKYPISAVTDDKGNFAFTTYEANDGLPPGSYTLTFSWLEPGIVQVTSLPVSSRRGLSADRPASMCGAAERDFHGAAL